MRFLLICLCTILSSAYGVAQDASSRYERLAVVFGLKFQNFALPFQDMQSNFTHPGLLLGVEIPYNKRETLIQQVAIGGYLNREIGNGVSIGAQLGYRPKIHLGLYGEVKLGLSYLRVFHPTQAFEYAAGEWKEVVGGKSQLAIPLDFGFGYSLTSKLGEMCPYVVYQLTPALFYNEALPVNIYTNILIGIRIKPYLKSQ